MDIAIERPGTRAVLMIVVSLGRKTRSENRFCRENCAEHVTGDRISADMNREGVSESGQTKREEHVSCGIVES